METEYARAYRDLYEHHWWWRAREEFLVSVLQQYALPGEGRRILDVGCGGGLFWRRLSEFGEVRGVEPDTSMRTGDAAIDERIHWGELERYRPPSDFSAVLFLDVLEHLAEPVEALKCATQLLQPGGVVIATVPAFPLLWTRHDEMNHHLLRYTKRSFLGLARAAGLRARVLRYFFHWTFPVKLGVRIAEWAWPARFAGRDIPSTPPSTINRLLYLTSRLEQVSGLGRVLPFGSSLLFVGGRTSGP